MSNGKGDRQRKRFISLETLDENWKNTFHKEENLICNRDATAKCTFKDKEGKCIFKNDNLPCEFLLRKNENTI